MSYRQHYTGYVHYSGSVSYPASQSGGSVNYSGSEPVYITIEVDTNAFDASIVRCNQSLDGLTTAVVTTEAAQVAAKQKATKKISNSIIDGFFQYVGADLSQKIKELMSKCESFFFALTGHKESCLSKNKQMQDDYNRITKRYSKIFEDLDKEIISRIAQLDKPTFQFADTAQNLINQKANNELFGISTVSANENIQLETLLSCSHIKQQASTLLKKAENYLQGTYKLERSLTGMFEKGEIEGDVLLPILYLETTNEKQGKEHILYKADIAYNDIDNQILNQFKSDTIQWNDMESDEFDKIISYLNADIQSRSIEDRTLKTMFNLLKQREIQTIKP